MKEESGFVHSISSKDGGREKGYEPRVGEADGVSFGDVKSEGCGDGRC